MNDDEKPCLRCPVCTKCQVIALEFDTEDGVTVADDGNRRLVLRYRVNNREQIARFRRAHMSRCGADASDFVMAEKVVIPPALATRRRISTRMLPWRRRRL